MPSAARRAAGPPAPPSPRKVSLRFADAEERLIERKLQNAEVLTLSYQIEQQRQFIDRREGVIADIVKQAIRDIEDGKQKSALTELRKVAPIQEQIRDALLEQNRLLQELEKVETRDVQTTDEDQDRLRLMREEAARYDRSEKVWRLGEAR